MNKNQTQSVKGGVSIQSGGDTNIGVTPAQMSEIMQALAANYQASAEVAKQIVDVRLQEFEHAVLSRFVNKSSGSTEAFCDPDFQSLLAEGQKAYARQGDDEVKEMLAELIFERSKQNSRNRVSLSLNDAVEKASRLTRSEFSEITICFTVRHVGFGSTVTATRIGEIYKSVLDSQIDDVEVEDSSYSYMQSHGCGIVQSLVSNKIDDILFEKLKHLFQPRLSLQDIIDIVGYAHVPPLLKAEAILCTQADPQEFVFNFKSEKDLDSKTSDCPNDIKEQIKQYYKEKSINKDDFVGCFQEFYPNYPKLREIWQKSPLKGFHLTTTGMAIGHANFVQLSNEDAPIETWIK